MPLRSVWPHEAHALTTWLQDNLDVLNSVLDITLAAAETEQNAGSFRADLVAEDTQGDAVIIENQLEKSDHDHLGKLVTYTAAFNARAAVWITSDPRPEHVTAVGWLNETGSASFYLVKLEAVRIDQSNPAPLLTLIVGPSETARQAGTTKKQLAEQHLIRKRFWTELLSRAKSETRLHSGVSPSDLSYVSSGAGKSGLALNYVVRQHEARVELYFDRPEKNENETAFEKFLACRSQIETEFGGSLDWERMEAKKACRIRKDLTLGGYRDEASWDDIHKGMIDAMVRLERAVRPHIDALVF